MRSKIFYFLIFLTYLPSCSYAPKFSKEARRWNSIAPSDRADYSDSSVVAQPTIKYQAGSLRNLFFGYHYRKEWRTPIKVPVLDLKTEKGGLIPYGIGGGKQSVSLKLRNMDDKEYILRSINKDPTKAVPQNFRQTFIHDIVDDQISAQHPYGALAVPPLADAVNVYHTNPRVVLIPNDSSLGPYREQFRNMLVLFEEDPDESHDDVASLGNSENIVGTDRMRELIESDNDILLDERNFLRARLLDMLIGDWDRHERQYRWASIKTGDREVFRPVPEDRDQVFFKFDGIIPYFASRKWALRNLQNFEADMGDIKGLNTTPRFIDRRYLSSLSRNDWKEIADSMKTELTDEVITKAVKEFPAEVFPLHGPEIISKLKSRRDQLPEATEEYYLLLSKYVNVFGTDKHERFEIERINHQQTKVTVYKIKKDGEIRNKLYERTFLRKETKEIRLYGLGGEDVFELKGNVKRGIKIRLLGGEGEDEYIENSRVGGIVKKSIVYDTKKDNTYALSKETNKELSKKETIHYPSLDNFAYNYLGPQITLDYNPDDGLFFGGGFLYRKYKFRQNPYGAMHKLLASIATSTGSVRVDYKGEVKSVVSSLDLGLDLELYTPAYVMNFFGYGNESLRKDTAIEYYRVRLQQAVFNPSLNKTVTRYFTLGLGPKYQYFRLERNASTFLGENSSEASDIYSSRQYAGLRGFFRLGTKDNERNPTRGILLTGEANFNQRIDDGGSYSQFLSDFSFYITPNIPFQLTFAGRVGGAMNFGEYEFYQANSLGSVTGLGFSGGNLRGFRRTRFVGDHAFYQNAEVRAQLFRFKTYIFPGKFGVLGFFDNGRVWAENENSHKWHIGYGGGIWMDIFHHFIASASYGFSEDDQVITFRLGFFF